MPLEQDDFYPLLIEWGIAHIDRISGELEWGDNAADFDPGFVSDSEHLPTSNPSFLAPIDSTPGELGQGIAPKHGGFDTCPKPKRVPLRQGVQK